MTKLLSDSDCDSVEEEEAMKKESEIEGTDRGKRARVTPAEGEDQISELSDEILVSILSWLTLSEAVRTSVLSKRWRYVWTCISSLNFDANDSKWGSVDACNYSKWVSSVLAQHRGPNVDEFRVCYDLNEAYTSHIDQWIEFALSNRVHTIDISLSHFWWRPSGDRCYRLPSRVLGLDTLGFKSLKTLSLNAVTVDDKAIEYFLSNCPLLERLCQHFNFALRNLKVVGPSLMLRHLEVVSCCSIETIEIRNTNLLSFTYVGKRPKFLLINAPRLVEVSIDPCGSMLSARGIFSKLSCCFSRLENLQLTFSHFVQENLRTYMFPKLKNLKQSVLVVQRWSNESLLGILAMIKQWPNLQRFVLQLQFRGIHRHDKERRAAKASVKEAAAYCHPCLKVLEIAGYCNTCDFELFKHIIENIVTLEKFIIDTRHLDGDSDSDSESSKNEKNYRELRRQLRTLVSPGVKLVIL